MRRSPAWPRYISEEPVSPAMAGPNSSSSKAGSYRSVSLEEHQVVPSLERIQAAAASWVEMKSFTWSRASCGVTSAMKWARLFTEFWSEARHSSR